MLNKNSYLGIVGKKHEGYWLAKFNSISDSKPTILRQITEEQILIYQRKHMLCSIGLSSNKYFWHTIPFSNTNEAENYRPSGCLLKPRIV